ncbi:hypothetical protein F3J44_14375 [Pantoea sp. Tr-811]|uniref:hypothetical protein n=1 Tax=Pantoea sp. Tr-811 TaxID=2608361 RepID=UPI00142105FE|nr:hypothetical protein [Pantoea sp. Tr-811]NIF27552.1 hypothetical protein [Pantoea sp. Tr-811]
MRQQWLAEFANALERFQGAVQRLAAAVALADGGVQCLALGVAGVAVPGAGLPVALHMLGALGGQDLFDRGACQVPGPWR